LIFLLQRLQLGLPLHRLVVTQYGAEEAFAAELVALKDRRELLADLPQRIHGRQLVERIDRVATKQEQRLVGHPEVPNVAHEVQDLTGVTLAQDRVHLDAQPLDLQQAADGLVGLLEATLHPDLVVRSLEPVERDSDDEPARRPFMDGLGHPGDAIGEPAVRRDRDLPSSEETDDLNEILAQAGLSAPNVQPDQVVARPRDRLDLLKREVVRLLLEVHEAVLAPHVADVRDMEDQMADRRTDSVPDYVSEHLQSRFRPYRLDGHSIPSPEAAEALTGPLGHGRC